MTALTYFSLVYNITILSFIVGLMKSILRTPNPEHRQPNTEHRPISVIIACKNEAHNIPNLINALKNQSYPAESYEVILANDNSTDDTAEVIKSHIADLPNFHYHFVEPTSYPYTVGKKKAITSAVAISKGEILAFTDADCLPDTDWLADINYAIQGQYDFYAGYSPLVRPQKSDLRPQKDAPPLPLTPYPLPLTPSLKNLERASIFAICASGFGLGVPLTCTARNMAYTRALWDKAEGFKGINHIRSGDDDLMLHKLMKFIEKYHFSFNHRAFVPSVENKDFSSQIHSETRRTSKFIHYPIYIKLLVLMIASFYGLLLYRIGLFIVQDSLCDIPTDLLVAIGSKLALEMVLLTIFLQRVRQLKLLVYFPIAELLYIPYFLFFGIKGTLGRYKWKS